ncbi:MAG: carboxymuconolactone decarboxylase family protein, partial [Actinobacteria bacterium]
ALHAPAPEALAAAWVLLRETLVVRGVAPRASKEAVAMAVSMANACPYCATIHSNNLGTLGGLVGGSAPTDDGPAPSEAELEDVISWAMPADGRPRAAKPPFPPAQGPELAGVAVLLHYFNRMVNVFLRDVPLPPGVPALALSPVLRVLGWVMAGATRRPHLPGNSLDLLPAAPLPEDLSWTVGNATMAQAFGRACAAIDDAGVEQLVAGLPDAERPAGRLALLVAFASYQVDAGVIANCRRAGADDRTLVEITSWAAMAAARWQGGLLPMPD